MAVKTAEQEALQVVIDEKLAANRALLNEYHASTDEARRAALTLEIDARSAEVRVIQSYFRSLRVRADQRYRGSILGNNLMGVA